MQITNALSTTDTLQHLSVNIRGPELPGCIPSLFKTVNCKHCVFQIHVICKDALESNSSCSLFIQIDTPQPPSALECVNVSRDPD